jgi:hypothetical protein
MLRTAHNPDEPRCCCYQYEGDNPDCPIHGKKKEQRADPDRDNEAILNAARKAGFKNVVMVRR